MRYSEDSLSVSDISYMMMLEQNSQHGDNSVHASDMIEDKSAEEEKYSKDTINKYLPIREKSSRHFSPQT